MKQVLLIEIVLAGVLFLHSCLCLHCLNSAEMEWDSGIQNGNAGQGLDLDVNTEQGSVSKGYRKANSLQVSNDQAQTAALFFGNVGADNGVFRRKSRFGGRQVTTARLRNINRIGRQKVPNSVRFWGFNSGLGIRIRNATNYSRRNRSNSKKISSIRNARNQNGVLLRFRNPMIGRKSEQYGFGYLNLGVRNRLSVNSVRRNIIRKKNSQTNRRKNTNGKLFKPPIR